MLSTKTKLLTSLALAALMPAVASAATVTVSTVVGVTQQVNYDRPGDPNYQDPHTLEYIYWDEYYRIITEEANVWDPSQIPANSPPSATDPYDIRSEGTIAFNFVFDDSTLDTANLQFGSADPQNLSGAVSMGTNTGGVSATISYGGTGYSDGAPGPMTFYATNDFATGDPGVGTIDALFVLFADSTNVDGSTEYAFFAAGFHDKYFENLTGGTTFNWEDASLSYLEVFNSVHSYDGDPLFDERIRGFGMGYTVTAGGGGGGTPSAVPLPAALPMLLAGLGGLAMVRRRRKV